MKAPKQIKITKEQILIMERKVLRDMEIQNQTRVNHKNVHKSKQTYTRKGNKDWAE